MKLFIQTCRKLMSSKPSP